MARKQKMKVYHGIPKSITDEHTLFYESCDGKLDNSYTVVNPISFYPNVTGYGVYGTTTDEFNFALTTECKIQTKVFTVDFWATMKTPVNNSYAGRLFELTFNNNSNYKIRLEKDSSSNRFHLWENANLVFGEFDFSSANINKPHHFRIIFKVGDYCKMYIDGKEPNIVQYQNKLTTTFEYISHIRLSGSNFSISDFHISNIDRGDYFPNLPKDFIEGKAVIKPRMGQQQKKGDPMYSQITNLKVEAFTGVEYPTLIDSNYYMHRYYPELSAKGANHWNAGSSFRIKGLNGELISGVIDSDTALCKVTKDTIINGSTATIEVNDTSKLIVGDTIKLFDPYLTPGNAVYTITSTTDTSFTADLNMNVTNISIKANHHYFMETTASSSAPTVKTQEGTTVVGTWSGLGTNEATFTLGDNSNIVGKDLYVEYALTMPYGNSDFPELPCEITKAYGENDVEMKPVSEIVIVDDFKGKVTGSLKECPHYASFVANTNLKNPDYFTPDSYVNYQQLENLDNKPMKVSNKTSNGNIGQVLLSYDLISIVEHKLGESISVRNKVQWVKENITSVVVDIMCFGSGASGNKVNATVYFADTNVWNGAVWTHNNSSLANLNCAIGSSNMSRVIDTQGRLHFLVYTNASDGTVETTLHIDYTKVTLTLKNDSTYTSLYCDNKRAREDVCNPILVQKETKTVKRYLPSNTSFVTEGIYVSPTRVNAGLGDNYVVKDETYLTTLGSGDYLVHESVRFKNCINKLGLGIKAYQYENTPLGKTTVGSYSDLYTIREVSQPYPTDNLMYPPKNIPNVPCLTMTPYLLNIEGELTLGLLALELDATGSRKASYITGYKIPNRPLIK